MNEFSSVAVIIPALNEAESLPHVLKAMPPVGHVFVVDNGSTDSTAKVASALGATVLTEPHRGYGLACQRGIAAAHAASASVIVILDGDHSFAPLEIGQLIRPILDGEADMVLGDRTETAEPGALLPQQRFGNWVATRLIGAVSGHQYRDMGPFRAVRTQSLIDMQMSDPNYGWNVEMQLKAVKYGLRIREIPVTCRSRIAGQSKVSGSVRGAVKAGAKMMWATWRYAR